jgi:outer membrane protein assembly complex protein YaeT
MCIIRLLKLRYWSLLSACLMLACLGCAAKEGRLPEEDATLALPEVKHITFRGNTSFGSRKLRQVMAIKQRPFLPPWKHGEPYNPPTLQADLRRLKKFYFDQGFLETTVRQGEVQEDAEKRTVSLEILIDEGPPTMVQAVHIAGSVPSELPAAQALREALPLRAGTRITKEAFDQSKALLLVRLHDAGYARAQVEPRTEVDTQQHTATITFTLHPGARTSFGRLTITGAEQVKERAIRHALTIHEGQTYSAKGLTESTEAIYGLGMFQAVTPRALNFEDTEAPLDVAFEVRERKPRTIRLGVGFSTVESMRFLAEWSHHNLFGGAQQLALTAKVSGIEQGFEGRLYFPYFLAPRTTFTQTLFVRNEQFLDFFPFTLLSNVFNIVDPNPAYDLLSVGSEARVEHRISRPLSISGGLELSLNVFRNVNLDALLEAGLGAAEDNLLLIQFTELQWNTRDSVLNPTRGVFLRGRVDNSTTAVLSDVSFVKLVLEGRYYRQLWGGLILATRLLVGAIQPYAGTEDLPFNVRFYAGGPGSVRGFALNRLGPLDANGDPIGGNSLIEGSVELRFPIVGNLTGAVFVDFGNVFSESFTYRLDELRYAVGPGIRYNTPIGPLRLDVGFIIDRQPGEDFGRVEFSIGQAF